MKPIRPLIKRRGALLLAGFAFVQAALVAQSSVRLPEGDDRTDEVIRMDPFTINEKNLVGWNSQMTFSGNRTAQDLLSIPMNIPILTSDYLKDIGATNIMGALQFAASGVSLRVNYRNDITVCEAFARERSGTGWEAR